MKSDLSSKLIQKVSNLCWVKGVTTGKTSPKSQIVQGSEFILIFCDGEPEHIGDKKLMSQRRVEKKPGPLLLKRGVSLLAGLT